MTLNKPLIRKMIKRIETMPETYYQGNYAMRIKSGQEIDGRPVPVCGTVACLAGEAVICSERSVKNGIAKLFKLDSAFSGVREEAESLTGIEARTGIYRADADAWPSPYREQWFNAKTYKGKARAAVNLLKAILKTGGRILTDET